MRQLVLALLAGSVAVLAYSPFELWWLLPMSLGLLFYLWSGSTPSRCFWLGFSYGFGLFMTGISWVYISLQVYGQMPVALAAVAVTGFVAYLSLFPALAGYFQARINTPERVRLCLVMPISWVVFEWVRGWALTGFPWLNIGYTQAALPLSGFAPLGGIYLVGLAVAVAASCLVMLVGTRRAPWVGGTIILILFVTGWGLSKLNWVRADGESIDVAAVQGNISLTTKWQTQSRAQAIEQYLALSPMEGVDLVVWPETAVSHYIEDVPEKLWTELSDRDADYAFGTIEAMKSDQEVRLFNSVVVLCGDQRQVYRKRHLVPFGEYMPLKPVFGWIIEYLHIPMSDFSSWEETQPSMCAGGGRISVSVCYEDAFGNEMRRSLGDSNMLLNVSEDAWFGDSLAPHQRLQMARMRVIEVGRPMVRASNTGPSAIIDHEGSMVSITDQFEPGVAQARVQPMQGKTPYTRLGDSAVIVILILVLVAMGYRYRDTARK